MKTSGSAAESEAQRVVMFATSRPYAFASQVRGEVPSQRRRTHRNTKRLEELRLTMRTILSTRATQMFNPYSRIAQAYDAAQPPPYAQLMAAQRKPTRPRGERDSSVESDHTTDKPKVRMPFAETSVAKIEEGDDDEEVDVRPRPEAGVTCACCRTQKTPLWRNGPTGAKTLCNACGVRFKAGRIVCDENGNVITLPTTGRRRSVSSTNNHTGNGAAAKRPKLPKNTVHYPPVQDTQVYELERTNGSGSNSVFPRMDSATILTDYDGAVLLMLLHDGDEED